MIPENELREMLRSKAAAFTSTPRPLDGVSRRARIRTARRALATLTVLVAAVFAGTTVAGRLAPGERAFAALRLSANVASDDAAPRHRPASPGGPVTLGRLEENVKCMRERGFDLPDPVATPDGWQVVVEEGSPLPSESPDPTVRKRWARAVFVDCRLLDATGELVLGGRSREQVERLMACARAKGFRLPAPTQTSPGEFTFDLGAASPPWGSQAWYRTVFVTCGLWRAAP
jgi:hypothetical protein